MSGVQIEFPLGGNLRQSSSRSSASKEGYDLFVTTEPTDEAREQTARVASCLLRRLGVREATRPFHVTLWKLGMRKEFSRLRMAETIEQLKTVCFEPFMLRFDEIVSLKRTDPKWPLVLRCSKPVEPLFDLYRRIAEAQSPVGVEGVSVPTFTPHMTLFYSYCKIGRKDLKPPVSWPVSWLVRDFHIIWSHLGDCRHERLWTWPPSA